MPVIHGIEELEKKLEGLSRHLQQKVLRESLKKAAESIADEASRRAPVLTGALAEHQGIQFIQSESNSTTAVVHIGPERDVFYGMFQEFGTEHHDEQEFLGPAFEQEKEGALKSIAGYMKDEIDKYAASESRKQVPEPGK